MNAKCRQGGVTLIEVAIAVTIIAIGLSLGVAGFTEWIQNSQIRTVSESINAGLNQARSEAIRRNARVEFVLSTNVGSAGATGWTVRLAGTGTVLEQQPDNISSQSITVTATPSGATHTTFDGSGRRLTGAAANADGSAFLTQIDVDSTVLSAGDSKDMRVMIGAGGISRMCDPNIYTTGDTRKC